MKKTNPSVKRMASLTAAVFVTFFAMAVLNGCGGEQEKRLEISPSDQENTSSYAEETSMKQDNILTPEIIGDAAVAMVTSKSAGEELTLYVDGEDLCIDLGDGEKTEFIEGETNIVKGPVIRLYGDIEYLYCTDGGLTELDLSGCPGLYALECGMNSLTRLDVSANTALSSLNCQSNHLTALDLCHNAVLDSLNCSDNQLECLDLSGNSGLTIIDCNSNRLRSLDVTDLPLLKMLFCYHNELTQLDLSENSELEMLNCGYNKLTSLDISGNPMLQNVICPSNSIDSLDLSSNENLVNLLASHNLLTEIELDGCPLLVSLDLSYNSISALDLSQNTMLENLHASNNIIPFSEADRLFLSPALITVELNPQRMTVVQSIDVDGTVDLSSEYTVDETTTQFTWYDCDGNTVVPSKSENGVFTFGAEFAGQSLCCIMKNDALPGTLKTEADGSVAATAYSVETSFIKIAEIGEDGQEINQYEFEINIDDQTGRDIVRKAFITGVTVIRDNDGNIVDPRYIRLVVSDVTAKEYDAVVGELTGKYDSLDPEGAYAFDLRFMSGSDEAHNASGNAQTRLLLRYPDGNSDCEYYVFSPEMEKIESVTYEKDGLRFDCYLDGTYVLIKHKKAAFSAAGVVWLSVIGTLAALAAAAVGAFLITGRKKRAVKTKDNSESDKEVLPEESKPEDGAETPSEEIMTGEGAEAYSDESKSETD